MSNVEDLHNLLGPWVFCKRCYCQWKHLFRDYGLFQKSHSSRRWNHLPVIKLSWSWSECLLLLMHLSYADRGGQAHCVSPVTTKHTLKSHLLEMSWMHTMWSHDIYHMVSNGCQWHFSSSLLPFCCNRDGESICFCVHMKISFSFQKYLHNLHVFAGFIPKYHVFLFILLVGGLQLSCLWPDTTPRSRNQSTRNRNMLLNTFWRNYFFSETLSKFISNPSNSFANLPLS